MSLNDSVSLVKHAFTNATTGDLFVKKAPACTVQTLVEALVLLLNVDGASKIQRIGTRHGEKLFESLIGTEESLKAIDQGDYFRVPLDTRSLDYNIYFSEGQENSKEGVSYNSHNAPQLNVDQVVELIGNLPEFKKYMEVNS
jgi:UDP-glucose 4-epimerase